MMAYPKTKDDIDYLVEYFNDKQRTKDRILGETVRDMVSNENPPDAKFLGYLIKTIDNAVEATGGS